MRFIYPAIIHPNEDGTFTARMADLEGCEAVRDRIDRSFKNEGVDLKLEYYICPIMELG